MRTQGTLQSIHALAQALQTSRLREELRIPSAIETLAFSPDGTELAVGSDDGALRLVRIADARLLWTQGRGALPAMGVAFASQGDVLAVTRYSFTSSGCTIELINARSGALQRQLESVTEPGCRRFVSFLGRSRIVAAGQPSGLVRMWNADTAREQGAIAVPPPNDPATSPGSSFFFSMGFSADGQDVAASTGYTLEVVRLRDGRMIAKSGGEDVLKPGALAFSPDGNSVALASRNATVVEGLDYSPVTELANDAEQSVVRDVGWSTDGRLFADATGDVHVWASQTDRLVDDLKADTADGFSSVAFSSRGLLAGGSPDGSIRIWAPDPDRPIRQILDPGIAGWSGETGDGQRIAVGSADGPVAVVDQRGTLIRWLYPQGDTSAFTVTNRGDLATIRGGNVVLTDLRSGQTVGATPVPVSGTDSVAVSANGDTIAALNSATGTLALRSNGLWHASKEPVIQDGVLTLALSADGAMVAYGGSLGSPAITILEARNLRRVRVEPGISAAFSRSNALMAIQRPDLSVAILDTRDWRTVAELRGATSQAVLSFSPDGRLLAAGSSGTLRTWDASDGTLLTTRYVIDEIGYSASNLTLSPPMLTAAGYAIVGAGRFVDTVDACVTCLTPAALLATAAARMRMINTHALK